MKRFRLTIEVCIRSFERDIVHVLIRAERQRKRIVKEMKQ